MDTPTSRLTGDPGARSAGRPLGSLRSGERA